MKRNFDFNYAGSIVIIVAKTKKALRWMQENLHTESWQWDGTAVYIDSRYSEDIEAAIQLEF